MFIELNIKYTDGIAVVLAEIYEFMAVLYSIDSSGPH